MKDVSDKLIEIFFKTCYTGYGRVTKEEQQYLNDNDFVCIVTDETKDNGYKMESDWIKENLEIGKEYTFISMDVGRSSSSLTIEEFPTKNFNTVCFEIRIKKP